MSDPRSNDRSGRACCLCRVSGRVQGVGFRASTRAQASRLGLAGHVVNLPDGRVEVLLYGPFEAVERMRTWLWQGPPAARVDAVDCADAPPPLHADFRLLRDF